MGLIYHTFDHSSSRSFAHLAYSVGWGYYRAAVWPGSIDSDYSDFVTSLDRSDLLMMRRGFNPRLFFSRGHLARLRANSLSSLEQAGRLMNRGENSQNTNWERK